MCYFSRSEEQAPIRFEKAKARIVNELGDKKVTIELAQEGTFEEQLKKADHLYVAGGDTERLFNTIRKFPGFKELVKGKSFWVLLQVLSFSQHTTIGVMAEEYMKALDFYPYV